MLLLKLLKSDDLLNAESALKQAGVDNLVSCCENYLLLLGNYRDELYKLRGTPGISHYQPSPLAQELTEQTRKSVRAAIESTVRERNQTEALLKSLTCINGYDAVKTFNRLEYKGFAEWELGANEVRPKDNNNDERFTLQEAVEIAGLLRRTAYISNKTLFL